MNKCSNCFFGGLCFRKKGCEHYSPIDDERELRAIVENNRKDYDIEWRTYLKNFEEGN